MPSNKQLPRYKLLSILYGNKGEQTSFIVKDIKDELLAKVSAEKLFYSDSWLSGFAAEDVRRIAFAVTEAAVAQELLELARQ